MLRDQSTLRDSHCVYGGCTQGSCLDGQGHNVYEMEVENSVFKDGNGTRFACRKCDRFLFAHSDKHG